jgi:hypothetical protein
MFGKTVAADALVIADEGSGSVVDTDLHGVDWKHHKFILEVRPAGESPFRVETKTKVPIFSAPQPGDLVHVVYEPKNHKTEMVIEGDARYDPKLIRARRKLEKSQQAANVQALLGGANPPDLPSSRNLDDAELDEDDEQVRWTVPDRCPECGARVDQSVASVAEHPACPFCHEPLPCQPVS